MVPIGHLPERIIREVAALPDTQSRNEVVLKIRTVVLNQDILPASERAARYRSYPWVIFYLLARDQLED